MTYLKKRTFISILLIVAFFLGFYVYDKLTNIDYNPTKYELELIDYFKEISLNSEFDKTDSLIIKWKKPMVIFVLKEEENIKQMKIVNDAIREINELATDGFEILLTTEKSKSNTILYLMKKEKVEKLDAPFFKGIDENFVGLSEATYDWNNNITSAKIFIDVEEPIDNQESIILEELTQCIGLLNDSEKYPSSIFFDNQSNKGITNKSYSPIDKDIIKILYHPRMKTGLNEIQVKRVIKRILKNNEIELSGETNQ